MFIFGFCKVAETSPVSPVGMGTRMFRLAKGTLTNSSGLKTVGKHALTGAAVGAVHGATSKDEYGQSGGLGGAIRGGLTGGAVGGALGVGHGMYDRRQVANTRLTKLKAFNEQKAPGSKLFAKSKEQ